MWRLTLGKLMSRTFLGLAIGALFVWLSARDWPMASLAGAIGFEGGHLVVGDVAASRVRGAAPGFSEAGGWVMDLWWLFPYLAILTVIHVLRVIRWKPLVDPITNLDWTTHNRIGAVGFMAMFLMPLRLGELVRPFLVKRASGETRTSEVLPTVVVERIVDGLVVVLILFVVLAELPSNDPATMRVLQAGAYGSLGVFLAASALLVAAGWKHDWTVSALRHTIGVVLPGPTTKVIELVDAFLGGLRALPSPVAFANFVILTLVYWLINGIGVWAMARAFYLPVDLVGAYAMMSCVVVGMMIPNSPGNVGSFWYFLLLPLPLYGVQADSLQAISCGIMVWWLQLVQQTGFGLWFVLRKKVTWRRVLEATRSGSEGDSPLPDHSAPRPVVGQAATSTVEGASCQPPEERLS